MLRHPKRVTTAELERGYYAVMGGYEVVIDEKHGKSMDNRWTLTPDGTVLLASLGLLPSMPVEDIKDKSKADSLTKMLVCTQACWMLVQALARKLKGLPVTLLELNTIMHVACALLMYLLWLKKPQDVRIPTHSDERNTDWKSLATLLRIEKVERAEHRQAHIERIGSREGAEIYILRWKEGAFELQKMEIAQGKSETLAWNTWNPTAPEGHQVDYFWIYPSKAADTETYISFQHGNHLTLEEATFLVKYSSGETKTFGKTQLPWNSIYNQLADHTESGCVDHASNFRRALSPKYSMVSGLIILMLSGTYGAVHLTPWNAHFPTYLERYLWRFSSLCIVCGYPIFTCLLELTRFIDFVPGPHSRLHNLHEFPSHVRK